MIAIVAIEEAERREAGKHSLSENPIILSPS
jgi:hypothetical protein